MNRYNLLATSSTEETHPERMLLSTLTNVQAVLIKIISERGRESLECHSTMVSYLLILSYKRVV